MANCKEKANEWNIPERSVTYMCQKGKIPGAVKTKGYWEIPNDAKKPIDGRITSGKYIKKRIEDLKQPPIDVADYIKAQSDYYYVDKTLMIKDILDKRLAATLFTRPRGFGKTLNMDMLKVFFEKTNNDTSVYFKDKKIWKCGDKYTKEQGKYPVIFLSFKDVKSDTWESSFKKLHNVIKSEFLRHSYITSSPNINQYDKSYYTMITTGNVDEVDLSSSLLKLSEILRKHFEIAPIIIVDDYDTPIQEGYSRGYYDKIICFMTNLLSGAFKDNHNLSYGFMTGILHVSENSILSGLNNIVSYSILNKAFDEYFGFTQSEVKKMLGYYKILDKEEEIKEWYDGYMFGETKIYNPLSVLNYIAGNCQPLPYWANTSPHGIISTLLTNINEDITEKLCCLMDDSAIYNMVNENIIYKYLTTNSSYLFDLLLMSGYLKITEKRLLDYGFLCCKLTIPNKELRSVYKTEIISYLQNLGTVKHSTLDEISECLKSCNISKLEKTISEYISRCISFYDTSSENFYYGLLLGFFAVMDGEYIIKSNRESENGMYDICLFPKYSGIPGIIIELKYCKKEDSHNLDSLAKEAMSQIIGKSYDAELKEKNVTDILRIGIAFEEKNVCIHSSLEE